MRGATARTASQARRDRTVAVLNGGPGRTRARGRRRARRPATMSSPPPDDPYKVLGVPRTATTRDIGHAYRALLRAHHPDTRGEATGAAADAQLQRILAAYAILRDPARRAQYDRRSKPVEPGPRAQHDRPRTADSPIRAGPVRWSPATKR